MDPIQQEWHTASLQKYPRVLYRIVQRAPLRNAFRSVLEQGCGRSGESLANLGEEEEPECASLKKKKKGS
jgi:hypothetical protein